MIWFDGRLKAVRRWKKNMPQEESTKKPWDLMREDLEMDNWDNWAVSNGGHENGIEIKDILYMFILY